MEVKHNLEQRIQEKVNQLSVEQIEQVEKFIDSLRNKDENTQFTFASTKIAESAFDKVWNNPEDAEYDSL